jgi:hypothetical protein
MKRAPRCLKCGTPLPFQDPVDGSDTKPYDGAVAICWECGEAMLFQGSGFRAPTSEEFTELLDDKDFAKAMSLIALKNLAKANPTFKDPVAIVFGDSGHATVLATEPDEKCEMCGKMMECRAYGPRKADGVRMRVCFPCAEKDPDEMRRAFDERIEGQ